MAGEGSRFRDAGWATPKPLIDLDGKPLFIHAIESVKIPGVPMKYSFIVRKEHIDKYGIDKAIKQILPEANVFYVEKTTRGAVETCLIAEDAIADDDAVIIMDCDLEFRSDKYKELIEKALKETGEEARGGALVSFESNERKYSYAEVDANGRVIRTAEKEVISNHALCGAYFFASGKEFKQAAHRLLNEPVMLKPEFYVSLLFNYLLRDGSPVYLAPMEFYRSFGTPEELIKAMGVKLLITDFDGTLVDTFEANYEAYRHALVNEGIALTRGKYRECFGYRFDRFMEEMGISDEEVKTRIKERKAQYYPSYFPHLKVNKGLLELIRTFHRQGGMIAIASTARGKNLRNALRYIGADNDFDMVLAGESVTHGKPNPEIYLKVLDAMGVAPTEALVFEDSPVGLEAAQAAGIPTVKITIR